MDADQTQPDGPRDTDAPAPEPSATLIKRLEALYAKGPEIPSEVDERILQMAREQMGGVGVGARAGSSRSGSPHVIARIGPRGWQMGGAVGALLAASVAVAVWLVLPSGPPKDQLALQGRMDQGLAGEGFADQLGEAPSALRSNEPGEFRARRELAQAPAAASSAPARLGERSRDLDGADDFANEVDAVGGLAKEDTDNQTFLLFADRADAPVPADEAEARAEAKGDDAIEVGDVDGNGTLNILDALALARVLETDQALRLPGWDVNQDGKIDGADVTSIALAIVSLDRARATGGAS